MIWKQQERGYLPLDSDYVTPSDLEKSEESTDEGPDLEEEFERVIRTSEALKLFREDYDDYREIGDVFLYEEKLRVFEQKLTNKLFYAQFNEPYTETDVLEQDLATCKEFFNYKNRWVVKPQAYIMKCRKKPKECEK